MANALLEELILAIPRLVYEKWITTMILKTARALRLLAVPALFALSAIGCTNPFTAVDSDSWKKGVNFSVAQEYRDLVAQQVPSGTSREKVEAFFKEQGARFSSDGRFHQRYS
ncbi:MAG: hypothetical protein ACI9DC_005510, partial [Gammaproteobacteria bacterium]